MSLVSDIRKKSKLEDAPELTISKDHQERLRNGEVVFIKDDSTDETYMIRINIEKIGSESISKEDLEIEKIKTPKAARSRDVQI